MLAEDPLQQQRDEEARVRCSMGGGDGGAHVYASICVRRGMCILLLRIPPLRSLYFCTCPHYHSHFVCVSTLYIEAVCEVRIVSGGKRTA